jgi:hypothetical protein
VNDSLPKLLLRSEAGGTPVLWGGDALPHHQRMLDRFLAAGILVERARATSWPVCRRCDGSCGERDVLEIDGALVAECPEYPDQRRTLQIHEVRSFTIDVPTVVMSLAGASDLTGGAEAIAPGAWLLGRAGGARSVILVLGETCLLPPDGPALISSRVEMAETTLLVPDSAMAAALRPFRDAGSHVAPTASALVGAELRLDPDVVFPPPRYAERLEINVVGRTATLDQRPLALTDQTFGLLLALARAAQVHGGFLDARQVQTSIYGSLSPPASRPLRDVARDLRDRLAAGLPGAETAAVRALILNRPPESYRLALRWQEIGITG